MKIETLKERIKKAEEKLIKINGTLERHNKSLQKIIDKLVKQNVDINNYDYEAYRHTEIEYILDSYKDKKNAIKETEKKLQQEQKRVAELKEQLKEAEAEENKINNNIPPVIIEFLQNWKSKAYDYYIKLANEYIAERQKEYEVTKENLQSLESEQYKGGRLGMHRVYTDEKIEELLSNEYFYHNLKSEIRYYKLEEWCRQHSNNEMEVVKNIVNSINELSEEKLNKILDNEMNRKKDVFIKKIIEIVGSITDATELYIADNGEINGIITGEKAKARIQTIYAGGYNIQCLHFRMLINVVD